MSYAFQTFSALQVLTAAQMTSLMESVRDHRHGTDSGVSSSLGTISITGVLTEPNRCGAYQWAGWNPTDVSGTLTNAGSSSTYVQAATNFMTIANASGTVTFTFTKAGTYLMTVRTVTAPVADVDAGSYNQIVLGGTATRALSLTTITQAMDLSPANYGANIEVTFLVVATANQTVTVLPKVALVRAAGTASNYPTYAEASAIYAGSA